MDWRVSLDRYLTTEPEDNYTPWIEEVYNNVSEQFIQQIEKDDFIDSRIEDMWLNYLYDKGYSPKQAGSLIEKAYQLKLKTTT